MTNKNFTIKNKLNSNEGVIPLSKELEEGEIAINNAAGSETMFIVNTNDEVVPFESTKGVKETLNNTQNSLDKIISYLEDTSTLKRTKLDKSEFESYKEEMHKKIDEISQSNDNIKIFTIYDEKLEDESSELGITFAPIFEYFDTLDGIEKTTKDVRLYFETGVYYGLYYRTKITGSDGHINEWIDAFEMNSFSDIVQTYDNCFTITSTPSFSVTRKGDITEKPYFKSTLRRQVFFLPYFSIENNVITDMGSKMGFYYNLELNEAETIGVTEFLNKISMLEFFFQDSDMYIVNCYYGDSIRPVESMKFMHNHDVSFTYTYYDNNVEYYIQTTIHRRDKTISHSIVGDDINYKLQDNTIDGSKLQDKSISSIKLSSEVLDYIDNIKNFCAESYGDLERELKLKAYESDTYTKTQVDNMFANIIKTYTEEEYKNLTDEEKNNGLIIVI